MSQRTRVILANVLLPLPVLAVLAWGARRDYLLFHSLSELFAIVIASGIFMVAWNCRRFHINNYLLFVGLAYLFVAIMDLLHMMAYDGMGVFGKETTDLATQLWVAGRFLQASAVLIAPLVLGRRIRPWLVLLSFALAFALLLIPIFSGAFPTCWARPSGLTPFKKGAEYFICLMLLAAMFLLWRHRSRFDRNVLLLLEWSLYTTIATELCFTLYHSPSDLFNAVGHLLKIVSFFLIYKAIIETGLSRPYRLLFRDLDQARAAAESAARAKDQFLAVLSHELRNPLNPVLIAASSLELNPNLPDNVREDVKVIRRNAQLEARLIDDLLDLTRISRGKLELSMAQVDAHEVIRQVIATMQADFDAAGLEFTPELTAASHHITADPVRFQQVLWNLFKNAVKFTPAGGAVRLRTGNPQDLALRIDVIDSGIGIDPAILPRIFDAFEQGSPAITRQFGGLGLGLAISRALIEMHGGTLAASSGGRGKGSCFTIELAALATLQPKAASPPDAQLTSRRLSILLVEDHEDTSRLMTRLLRTFQHDVEAVPSMQRALTAASGRRFDLVISDIGLPDGSGLELMRQLRTRYNMAGICVSGFGMDRDIENSIRAGFVQHLTKPVDVQRLQEAISKAAGV